MKQFKLLLITGLLLSTQILAQNVGINATGAAPDASAMLDIVSANRGLLIPRVALTATNAAGPIAAPTTSLLVYNTATAGAGLTAVTPGYYYWDGAAWVRFQASNTIDDWKLIGNAGTTAPTSGYGTAINNNFIGTTDAVDFSIGTNGLERFRIKTDNATTLRIGMGTAFTSNLNPSSTPSLVHLHDWGTTVNDYPILQLSTASTTSGRTVGIINFASTATSNEKRVATIESYLTAASATNATGDLRFFTNDNNSLTEKMRIEGDGDIGIGATPNVSAILDVTATDKGILAPRVALTATNAAGPITTPATGLLVYNTATAGAAPNNVVPGYYYNSGTSGAPVWRRFSTGNGDSWNTLGNAGTVAATNFVGTTDNIALTFRTNNLQRLQLSNTNYQVLAMDNGSVTNPFYSWSADTDMGIWRPSANTLEFVTGSLPRLRIPDANQVHAMSNGTALLPFFTWNADPDMGIYRITTNTLGFSTTGVERIRITGTGYVGVNQNTPLAQTHITTALTTGPSLYAHITPTNSTWSAGEFANTNTNGGTGVYSTGFSAIWGQTTNFAAGWGGYFNGDVNTTGGYFNISDQRLKENIKPINNVLENFKKLNVYSYNYKTGNLGLDSTSVRYGFMAQELMKIYPDMVKEKSFNESSSLTNNNNSESVKYLAVSYIELVPLTVIAIQEQQAIIEDLLKRIELLELELKNK